jgi:hypothetical protein
MNSQEFFTRVYEADNDNQEAEDPAFDIINNHIKKSHKSGNNTTREATSAPPPQSPGIIRRAATLPSEVKGCGPPALKSSISAPVGSKEIMAKGNGKKQKAEVNPIPIKKGIFDNLKFCMFVVCIRGK